MFFEIECKYAHKNEVFANFLDERFQKDFKNTGLIRVGEEIVEFRFGEGLLFFIRQPFLRAPARDERVELVGSQFASCACVEAFVCLVR